jgi:hypothetical protein
VKTHKNSRQTPKAIIANSKTLAASAGNPMKTIASCGAFRFRSTAIEWTFFLLSWTKQSVKIRVDCVEFD